MINHILGLWLCFSTWNMFSSRS